MVSLAPDNALVTLELFPPELTEPRHQRNRILPIKVRQLSYSVGVMAYNEEAHIRRLLKAIMAQKREKTCLAEIIVVASGCTDRTIPIVLECMREEPCIHLIIQKEREGKASAINLFLESAVSPLLVLMGANLLPEEDTLERLCLQFEDETVGMVGARLVPLNDQNTFIGHTVHLLGRLHASIARRVPGQSEVIAFRNIIDAIPTNISVDEISIQASIAQQGLRMVYASEALVYSKGPMTIRDFLAQRTRIYEGYLQARAEGHFSGSHVQWQLLLKALFENASFAMSTPRKMIWTVGAMLLEGLVRLRCAYVVRHRLDLPIIYPPPALRHGEEKNRKLRQIYNSQSVLVFQLAPLEGRQDYFLRKHEEHTRARLVRVLFPLIRKHIRKEDLLSLQGSDTFVLLINADPQMVHVIALRLKYLMESQQITLGRNRTGFPRIRYHAVTFNQDLL